MSFLPLKVGEDKRFLPSGFSTVCFWLASEGKNLYTAPAFRGRNLSFLVWFGILYLFSLETLGGLTAPPCCSLSTWCRLFSSKFDKRSAWYPASLIIFWARSYLDLKTIGGVPRRSNFIYLFMFIYSIFRIQQGYHRDQSSQNIAHSGHIALALNSWHCASSLMPEESEIAILFISKYCLFLDNTFL